MIWTLKLAKCVLSCYQSTIHILVLSQCDMTLINKVDLFSSLFTCQICHQLAVGLCQYSVARFSCFQTPHGLWIVLQLTFCQLSTYMVSSFSHVHGKIKLENAVYVCICKFLSAIQVIGTATILICHNNAVQTLNKLRKSKDKQIHNNPFENTNVATIVENCCAYLAHTISCRLP